VYAIQQCGRQLVSGGSDGTVRSWDLYSQRLIGRALRGHHGRVYALHFDGGKDIIIPEAAPQKSSFGDSPRVSCSRQ